MSKILDEYGATVMLAYFVWIVISGVVAATLNYRVGMTLIFAPLGLGMLIAALYDIVRMSREEIRGKGKK